MFKQPRFNRSRVPLTPATRLGVYAASGDGVASPKDEPARDEAYRRYVALKPCYRCGISDYSQAAHPNVDKGIGLKTDDRLCFPLCCTRPMVVGCHADFDQSAGLTQQERRELEASYVARARAEAAADGWVL